MNRREHSRSSCELLRRFGGGLEFRVVANHDEATLIWGHWLHRVWRPNNRESLRAKRKAQQNADGERFHIAVSLCIICAMGTPNPSMRSVGQPPPISRKTIRIGCRDNTRDETENNDKP
jgi:hypothetical protein